MKDFKQGRTEEGYFRQEELTFADCDCHQRAKLSTFLCKAANYGGYDYDARGLTHEKLLEAGEVFLLSRIALRVHRCPMAQEVLEIHTWERGIKGPHMQRSYRIQDEAGEVCVSIKSEWILVDPESRRIKRPSEFRSGKLQAHDLPLDCPEAKKLSFHKEEAEDWGRRVVRWSDLDGNGHLYSGWYGDIIWDALPRDLQEQTPRDFCLNYSHEATLGQELQLLGIREENGFRMEGVGPSGTCFICTCTF